MTQADSVHSTPRRFTPKIVGGTDFSADPSDSNVSTREDLRRKRQLLQPLMDTCRNQRLRLSRRDAWWAARRLTDYWRARMDWHFALSIAQQYDVADANSYPNCKDDYGNNHLSLVDLWRTALVKQMLTPAPDVAAVLWKRTQLRAGQHRYTDVRPERLERAIEADVEWLKAHPSRKSIAASRQAKKATEQDE